MNLVTDKTNVRADEVLVAVIGSPQVADLERTLGRCDDAEVVTLLSVVSSPPEAQVDLVVPGVDMALPDLLVAARVEWLQGRAPRRARRAVIQNRRDRPDSNGLDQTRPRTQLPDEMKRRSALDRRSASRDEGRLANR